MQVSKISSINYNNRTTHQKQQNPSFGKLLIGDGVSTELVQELVKNPEIKKLVRLFDNIGINLKATVFYHLNREGNYHFQLFDPRINHGKPTISRGAPWLTLVSAERLEVTGFSEQDIITQIKNLKDGTAIEKFEDYYNYSHEIYYPNRFKRKSLFPTDHATKTRILAEEKDRKQALKDVADFNQTLRSNKEHTNKESNTRKKSFWEKLVDLF